MIALFLIGSSTVIVMMVLIIVVGIARAPEGYEDSTGFHHGKCPDPAPDRAERKRARQIEKPILGESSEPAASRIDDPIVSVKKESRVEARVPKQSPVRKSAKTKTFQEDEIPPSFGGSGGGTAVSDSNTPFPFPDSEREGESFDTEQDGPT